MHSCPWPTCRTARPHKGLLPRVSLCLSMTSLLLALNLTQHISKVSTRRVTGELTHLSCRLPSLLATVTCLAFQGRKTQGGAIFGDKGRAKTAGTRPSGVQYRLRDGGAKGSAATRKVERGRGLGGGRKDGFCFKFWCMFSQQMTGSRPLIISQPWYHPQGEARLVDSATAGST